MFWILIAIALIALAFYFKWARVIVGIVAAGFACLLLFLLISDATSKREAELSKHRIAASEVEFQDLLLTSDLSHLRGRVKNNSPRYDLESAELRIILKDCMGSNCDVVGQTEESIRMNVPPGQTRGIEEYLYFSNVPKLRGTLQWEYKVNFIRGREPISR
jgi:hypothetical protein